MVVGPRRIGEFRPRGERLRAFSLVNSTMDYLNPGNKLFIFNLEN